MSALRHYLMSVCAAALFASFILTIVPEGRIRHIVKLGGALVVIVSVISPLSRLDIEQIAKSMAVIRMDAEQMQTGIEVKNREILSQLIKEQSEEYILDKAEEMDLCLSVEIEMREEGDYPYPVSVLVVGTVSEADQAYLKKIIEQDIGIPVDRQEWNESG